jgi:hypothetical protein
VVVVAEPDIAINSDAVTPIANAERGRTARSALLMPERFNVENQYRDTIIPAYLTGFASGSMILD